MMREFDFRRFNKELGFMQPIATPQAGDMQWTGLVDKAGTRIYEGDIVALDMWQGNEHGYIPEDGVIQWHQESSAFKWFSGDPSDGNNYWLSQADEKQREVIGNIYENPELLEHKLEDKDG